MARVYRHQYAGVDPKTGKPRMSKKWYISYLDANGRRRRVVGFIDRRCTDAMATDLEREAEMIRAGLKPRSSANKNVDLKTLLGLFEAAVIARGTQEGFARTMRRKLETIFEDLKWTVPAELEAEAAQGWLAERRRRPKSAGGLSAQSVCHAITFLRHFGRWLSPKYYPENPFAEGLTKPNIESDRRHVRRVLSPADLQKLLDTVRAGKPNFSFTGEQRAVLYELAARTGLRALELSRLTPEMFKLSEPATVTVPGSFTKNGEGTTLPLLADLASRLRPLVTSTKLGEMIWPGKWVRDPKKRKGYGMSAKMLKADLVLAGIPYRDERGRVFDFHALRAQFGSDLVAAGVSIPHIQKLMRHSDPKTTMKHYNLTELHILAEAVAKLIRRRMPADDGFVDGAGI